MTEETITLYRPGVDSCQRFSRISAAPAHAADFLSGTERSLRNANRTGLERQRVGFRLCDALSGAGGVSGAVSSENGWERGAPRILDSRRGVG